MKRIITSILILAMLTSLAACAAPAAKNNVSEAPSQTEAATPSPTAEPTPTPKPTPEPLTEGQQMYYTWLESPNNGDIYACLVAYKAYKNDELDSLIDSGEITEENINMLRKDNDFYCDLYEINLDDIFNDDVPFDDLNDTLVYFKMLLNLPVNLPNDIDLAGLYMDKQENILRNGHTAFSAFPQESQEKIDEMMELYRFIHNEEMFKEFDEKIQGDYLNPKEKWYVIERIVFFDTNNNNYNEPTVTYKNENMGFIDYMQAIQLPTKAKADIEAYINEAYGAKNDDAS